MVQLWPVVPRGRGIDAVWRSNGPKPYAVIEAKASCDPTKSLRALLGEAGDKTERQGANSGTGTGRGGGLGRRGGTTGDTAVRQSNGMVTQMSISWINARLQRAVGAGTYTQMRRQGYSRHVLFFSVPHGVAHAEALILHGSGRPVEHSSHASHQLTREWVDNQIAQVVNDRAGVAPESRRNR
jgi:hypothetical protein